MKRKTLFLRAIILLIGILILALCIFLLPILIKFYVELINRLAESLYPVIIFFYITVIPYFFTLYQALKFLSYIDQNRGFSKLAFSTLKKIKYCALTISSLYVVAMPLFYVTADKDDAPGLLLVALIITFISMVITFFAHVHQKRVKSVIDIKSEN